MTIGFSLGRSTCLSNSTIADNDTLDCLHLVLNFSVTASAAWDGGQAEWRAEVCSDGGQGWSEQSAWAKERVERLVLIVNVSEVVVVAHSSHNGPQIAVRAINGAFRMPSSQQPAQPRRHHLSSLLRPSVSCKPLHYLKLIHILLHSIPVQSHAPVLLY